MKKILVAEDEASIREFIVINLERAGYKTLEAENGEKALEIYEREGKDIDVAVLDIMMPGKYDGLDVCRELRNTSSSVGIIMLTAKTQEVDKIKGLTSGADDYVTKPFSPSELVARVDAIYRRVSALNVRIEDKPKEEIISGEFVLNMRNREILKNGKAVKLTQVEFQIIEYLFTNAGKTLDKTEILKKVWGNNFVGEDKIVDVNIRRLRMKIEDEPSNPKHIVTVWGLGYRWEA